IEQTLARIWQELLGVERLGRHDNFFDLGGHSLLVVQILARLRDEFDVEVPLRAVFEAPTVKLLAEQVALVLQAPAGTDEDEAEALLQRVASMSDEEAAAMLSALNNGESTVG
ncbi:phosphopantetheine-binding protein, partial [Rhizobacter sp. Root1221]|uniref:phosphopantetheine-binding protein n=1 Tax=Rhizobacter sp. Root1221 TaxID=1736433 RepID=UPI000A753C08